MAIAPLNQLFLPRIRRAGRQRAYARQILARWQQSVPGRLLPALERAALPLVAAQGSPGQSLARVLTQDHRVCLQGPLGSGRTLAIEQFMVQWARGQTDLSAVLPLHLPTPQVAAGPEVALQEAIRAAGFASDPLLIERGLAAGHWLIIIDDLDALPPARREAWRRWAMTLLHRYPALPLLVVQGEDAQPWADCAVWRPAPLTPELLRAWLKLLLPGEEPELLLGPLLHDERVRLIGERFADVALLAWTYGQSGFSANRGRLLATALDRLLRPLAGNDVVRVRTALAALGYAALHGTPQPAPAPLLPLLPALRGVVDLAPGGMVQFSRPLFAAACTAMHCAAQPAALPAALNSAPWPAVLRLTTGLMADPAEVYAAIARDPGPAATLLLGQCLREHHVPLHDWAPIILERLAQLAGRQPEYAPQVWELFELMPDVIAATIAEQQASSTAGERWVLLVVRMLPSAMGVPFCIDIIGDSRLARSTRRVAAAHIQTLPGELVEPALQALAGRALDPLGELLVFQALSTGSATSRALVTSRLQRGAMLPRASDATDARMIMEIGAALLTDQDASPMVQTAITMSMQGCVTETTIPGLLQACIAPNPALREAARRAVLTAEPGLALRALGRLVLGDDLPWPARSEALNTLVALRWPGAVSLLARAAQTALPLAGRLTAAQALGRSEDGRERLVALSTNPELPAALLTAISQTLGMYAATRPALLRLAANAEGASPLRATAVRALCHSGSDEALALLAGIVEHERRDLETLLAAIDGLRLLGDDSGVWALRSILLGPLQAALHTAWQAELDTWSENHPPATWNVARLSAALQWRWGRAMGAGTTDADAPGSMRELVETEAALLRSTAAQALGAINGPAARDVLREALLAASSADGYGPAPALASELINTDGAADVVYALHSHGSPLIRWVAANTLHQIPAASEAIRHAWSSVEVDPATRSAMLTALGSDSRIVPILETLVVDDHAPTGLRIDAVHALGQAGAAHAEGLLLALISSARDEPQLSTAALDVLEAPLSGATLNAVRAILRLPRPPQEVGCAALRCLVRAGDTESLALFLRFAQHDNTALAQAGIDGLLLCNDPTANALLSRLAHTSSKPTRVRLQAIGALLRLEGAQHLPMVRQLVEHGSLATRLLALELLLDVLPDPLETLQLMQAAWPLALRLRIAQTLAQHPIPEALELLEQALNNPSEGLALRVLALETLAEAQFTPALTTIQLLAHTSATPLPLRRRAISALGAWRSEPGVAHGLGTLASDELAYLRSWATAALLG